MRFKFATIRYVTNEKLRFKRETTLYKTVAICFGSKKIYQNNNAKSILYKIILSIALSNNS